MDNEKEMMQIVCILLMKLTYDHKYYKVFEKFELKKGIGVDKIQGIFYEMLKHPIYNITECLTEEIIPYQEENQQHEGCDEHIQGYGDNIPIGKSLWKNFNDFIYPDEKIGDGYFTEGTSFKYIINNKVWDNSEEWKKKIFPTIKYSQEYKVSKKRMVESVDYYLFVIIINYNPTPVDGEKKFKKQIIKLDIDDYNEKHGCVSSSSWVRDDITDLDMTELYRFYPRIFKELQEHKNIGPSKMLEHCKEQLK